MNIHVRGSLHEFCSYIVGAVRDCVGEVFVSWLSFLRYETINSLPLQGGLIPAD